MALVGGIFNRDMGRMVRDEDGPKLVGRPITDPNALSEANFFLEHGHSRAQAAEMARVRERQQWEAECIADLHGEPPDGICGTKGLSPQRARLAQYLAWRRTICDRQAALEEKKAHLESLISAPTVTESKIAAAISTTAAFLMGRGPDSSENRRQLDESLSAERHRADAARQALPELEKEIERATIRVAHIGQRESEFLNTAIVEAVDETGLGRLYLKKVGELRELLSMIFGLAEVAGGYGSGFAVPAKIELPRPAGLSSLSKTRASDFIIEAKGSNVLGIFGKTLLVNPYINSRDILPAMKP